MQSWFRWARRDRRLALIMLIDGVLAGLVVVGLVVLVWPPTPSPITPTPQPETVLPTVGFGPRSPVAPLPTANPTGLAALPNQGQSDPPPSPPGLPARQIAPPGNNARPTLTPTATPTPGP